MLRLFRVVLMILIASITQNGFCSPEDWKLLNQKANELYKGLDLKVTVSLMNNIKEDGDLETGGKVGIEIPVFAKEEREKERTTKVAFLREGATIIKEIEETEGLLSVKQEESDILKKSLLNEGIGGITKYFEIKTEVVKLKTLLTQKRREFEALCGKK